MKKNCPFCQKICSNTNSFAQHTIRCKLNPNQINVKKNKEQISLNLDTKYGEVIEKKYYCRNLKCKKLFSYNEREFKDEHSKYCSRSCANSRQHSSETKIRIHQTLIAKESSHDFSKDKNWNNHLEQQICHSCNSLQLCTKKENKFLCKRCYDENIIKCKECERKIKGTFKEYPGYCSSVCLYKAINNGRVKMNKELELFYINHKNKLSEIMKKSYLDNIKIQSGGKTNWYVYRNNNITIKVQGSYEYRTCIILETLKNKNIIKNWEYTNDRITYFDKLGIQHSYLIDFKVLLFDNSFYYLEIKGFKKEIDFYKWNATKAQGYKLEIWFKEQIVKIEKELNIKEDMWKQELLRQGWNSK